MSNNDAWENGPLADAFDVDDSDLGQSTQVQSTPPEPKTKESNSTNNKVAKKSEDEFNQEKEYPTSSKDEAVESLKRAAAIESYDNFQKIANTIEEKHPEALEDLSELEKVSYVVGRNIAEGIYDELQDQA